MAKVKAIQKLSCFHTPMTTFVTRELRIFAKNPSWPGCPFAALGVEGRAEPVALPALALGLRVEVGLGGNGGGVLLLFRTSRMAKRSPSTIGPTTRLTMLKTRRLFREKEIKTALKTRQGVQLHLEIWKAQTTHDQSTRLLCLG